MNTLRAFTLCSPLLLAACGEGYELIKTDKMFPYGGQRTAGSGVAYVLAKMMPKKELNVEQVKDTIEMKAVEAPREPVVIEEDKEVPDQMDQVFIESQKK